MESSSSAPSTSLCDPEACMRIRQYSTIINVAVALICLLLNLLVIYTVRVSDNSTMKAYALMIQMNAVVDIYHSIVAFVDGNRTNTVNGHFYVFAEGVLPLELSDGVKDVFMAINFSAFFCICMMTPLAFVFRYSIIGSGRPMSYGALKLAFFGCIAFAHAQAFLFLSLTTSPRSTSHEYEAELLESPFYKNDLPYFRFVDQSRPYAKSALFITTMILILENGITLFCGIQMYRSTKRQRHIMSPKTVKLNDQLNRMLFIQASYPILLCGLPTLFAVIFTQLSISVQLLTVIQNVAVGFVPPLNAITVLLVLPCYRRIVIRMITSRVRAESSVSAVQDTFKTVAGHKEVSLA